jgi:ketosteroid isomerase-like protein
MSLSYLIAAVLLSAGFSDQDRGEMVGTADAFDQAQLQQDRALLETMTDDELVFIEGSGKRSGKVEFIAGWTGAGDQYDPITLIDRTVTPTGKDSFVVSAETTLSGTSGGKPFSSRFRFSDTFRRKDGRWQAVHIQVTRIVE